MHDALVLPVLLYGSKAVVWKEKEKSWIRVMQVDSLRDLFFVRIDKMLNARVREL